MTAARMLTGGLAAASLAISATPAYAEAKPNAARMLALAGAESLTECLKRVADAFKARMKRDPTRKERAAIDDACAYQVANPGATQADVNAAINAGAAGKVGGVSTGMIIAGLVAVVGIGVGVAAGGTDTPSSP